MQCRKFPAKVIRQFAAILIATLTLVSISLATPQYRVLFGFTGGTDGGGLWASVTLDSKGSLYGTTSGSGAYGQGTVFKLKRRPSGQWTEKVLHSFNNNGEDGYDPNGGVILDAKGHIYGTTSTGGKGDYGVVFKIVP